MSLDTTKSIKSITYNGTEIPLDIKPEQEKTVTPTASGVVVTPDTDYTLSKVTVNGDSNLTAGNIKSGVKIFGVIGTYNNAKPEQAKTVDLSMASGNQVISPDSGKVLSSVTINKPSTLIPANIKKDVNIGGVVGTLESGTSSKIQSSKSLTITSNGTTTIMPDSGYDAIGQVGVTVNVASSTTASNIITFEYTPTGQDLAISHDVLVGAGIDTEDKFFKIIGISILPKNGDVDWFYVSYGGTLDKTKFMQNLTYNHKIGSILTFYNLSGQLPYTIALQASTHVDKEAINKTFIVTLVLSG